MGLFCRDIKMRGESFMRIKRVCFLALGILCLVLGCIGIALPVLPTVPFFLVTLFCFANSSERLYNWFQKSSLYKKYLESFLTNQGMLMKTKITAALSTTAMMSVGFILLLVKEIYFPCVIIFVVWVCLMFYFFVKMPTLEETM